MALGSKLVCFFIACIATYIIVCIGLVLSHAFQRALLYMHWIKFPRSLQCLEKFHIAQFARRISCQTADGETLHGWHLAPTRFGPALAKLHDDEIEREKFFDHKLADVTEPVIVFMHGQAGGRGLPNRLETCRAMAAQLQAHVLLFDYRGFGDSTGSPSQSGLLRDAAAMWQWLGARRSAGALLYGQSLGTAVAAHFAAQLEDSGGEQAQRLQGLVLDAPFASIAAAAEVHPWFRIFKCIPQLRDALLNRLVDKWNSENAVKRVGVPLLILAPAYDSIVGTEGPPRLQLAASRARTVHCANENTALPEDVFLVKLDGATHFTTHRCNAWLAALSEFVADVCSRERPHRTNKFTPRGDEPLLSFKPDAQCTSAQVELATRRISLCEVRNTSMREDANALDTVA
mmetsp:Transcript_44872/g.103807  ORF Transcript_44872/g.103807 Transcript_44872/m.103807 type:complete len:402 (+) Transcript_44872:51-1256(+)